MMTIVQERGVKQLDYWHISTLSRAKQSSNQHLQVAAKRQIKRENDVTMDFHVQKPKEGLGVVENPLFSRKNKRVCKMDIKTLKIT